MLTSLIILYFCINHLCAGAIKAHNLKMLPSKSLMKNSMESTIQHFKLISAGPALPKTDLYVGIEAPKGEFGIYLSSIDTAYAERIKIRAPGFFHLQGIKTLAYQHLLAYVVTIIGTMDIVFG